MQKLMIKLIKLLIKSYTKPDKTVVIRAAKNGRYKWYLYEGGKLRAISHPVRGFVTLEDAVASVHQCYRFDTPKIKINA